MAKKRNIGTNDPRNPKGLSAEELAKARAKRVAGKKAKRQAKAEDIEKRVAPRRKKSAPPKEEAVTGPKEVVTTPREISDEKGTLTPEQREAVLKADVKTSPRRGEEEGVRQDFIKQEEERRTAEIGAHADWSAAQVAAWNEAHGLGDTGAVPLTKEPVNPAALESERKLRPVPMPEFTPPTAGKERAEEAEPQTINTGSAGIMRFPGAGVVGSLPRAEDYNITQAGPGVTGTQASRNAENLATREERGMGLPGDEKGMVTIRHVGKAEYGNDLVDENVTVNQDLARAYNMQKAEHDSLVASGKRDPRVTPLPHPKSLYGGYYHGLVKVANVMNTTPNEVAQYAEKIGGRTRRADIVSGLVGATTQIKNVDKTEHFTPDVNDFFIHPRTGERHSVADLDQHPDVLSEMQAHPKTGAMSFTRSKGMLQLYSTDPTTLEPKAAGQYRPGWNKTTRNGINTWVKYDRPAPDHPMLRDLGTFLGQEISSTQPMGSKSLASREAAADKATGIARMQTGTSTGRSRKVTSGRIVESQETEAASSPLEAPAKGRGIRKKASPTRGGTRLFTAVQEPVVTPFEKKPSRSKQLQNVKMDSSGNPMPTPPVVGRPGDEPYYVSAQQQTYNNPFAKTPEEAKRGATMAQINAMAEEHRTAKAMTPPANVTGQGSQWQVVKAPKGPRSKKIVTKVVRKDGATGPVSAPTIGSKSTPKQFQGVLDFGNEGLTDTEKTTVYDRSNLSGPVSGRTAKVKQTIERPGTMWEEVKPTSETPATKESIPSIPSSAYVKSASSTGGALELSTPGKGRKSKAVKAKIAAANESAPLDLMHGDYRENALPVGVAGPQGPKVRGKRTGNTTAYQPEIDFNTPTHAGGAQWLGMVQKGGAQEVETARKQDRNWGYATTREAITSTPVIGEGDFIHHKRFGGGKVVGVQTAEHPITKQPDLHVSVNFGGETKGGMPNIRTLPMSEHADLMEKVTPESESIPTGTKAITRAKSRR
jgi:hypothetical protein